jgi:hypothetical protein
MLELPPFFNSQPPEAESTRICLFTVGFNISFSRCSQHDARGLTSLATRNTPVLEKLPLERGAPKVLTGVLYEHVASVFRVEENGGGGPTIHFETLRMKKGKLDVTPAVVRKYVLPRRWRQKSPPKR